MNVQSMILNLSFPKSLEDILDKQENNDLFDVEYLVYESNTIFSWTVPKWIKPGDIVFFMHSMNSIFTIRHLKIALKKEANRFTNSEQDYIFNALERGENIYSKFGGKIFALGQVEDNPFYMEPTEVDHTVYWKSRVYAYINEICVLSQPISLSEFDDFIKLSCGGAITPVYGNEFEKLKKLYSNVKTLSRRVAVSDFIIA